MGLFNSNLRLRKSRGQVAIEYLFVVGFAIIFITPAIIFFFSERANITDEVAITQLGKVGSELVDSINTIYYLGPPSKKTLKISMPQSLKNVSMSDNSITFTYDSARLGIAEYTIYADTNITGSIYPYSGLNIFVIEAEDDAVRVTN